MNKEKKKNNTRLGRIFEFALIGAAIVILIFIISYSVKLSTGVAKNISAPENNIRLEVLNASSEMDLDQKMREYLSEIDNEKISLDIIKCGDFDLRTSKESFIICRVKDDLAVKEFAKLINIDAKDVHISELEQNTEQLTATLILGDDSLYYRLLEKEKELE